MALQKVILTNALHAILLGLVIAGVIRFANLFQEDTPQTKLDAVRTELGMIGIYIVTVSISLLMSLVLPQQRAFSLACAFCICLMYIVCCGSIALCDKLERQMNGGAAAILERINTPPPPPAEPTDFEVSRSFFSSSHNHSHEEEEEGIDWVELGKYLIVSVGQIAKLLFASEDAAAVLAWKNQADLLFPSIRTPAVFYVHVVCLVICVLLLRTFLREEREQEEANMEIHNWSTQFMGTHPLASREVSKEHQKTHTEKAKEGKKEQ